MHDEDVRDQPPPGSVAEARALVADAFAARDRADADVDAGRASLPSLARANEALRAARAALAEAEGAADEAS